MKRIMCLLGLVLLLVMGGCGKNPQDPIYNDSAMLGRSEADLQSIQALRSSQNPQAALAALWGGKIEDRIRADFEIRGKPLSTEAIIQLRQKKDSGTAVLESKSGNLEGIIQKGEVLVVVSNDKNEHNGIYFLACLNGMVSEYNPNAYDDRGQIRNYPFHFTVEKGNGFTQVLSNGEAIQAAHDLNKPLRRTRLNESVVIVPPGFCLSKESPEAKWKQCNN